MPYYFDMHSHMLCGVDDGAKDAEEMYAMLEMAYADGVRALCLTPHYSPYLFGDTFEKSERAFELLYRYVEQKHPDLYLYLGHELGYHGECMEALNTGVCRSLAGGRYVLVDFPENALFFEIEKAMNRMLQSGYHPVLAHTERYRALHGKLDWVEEFVASGGRVQINASSLAGKAGMGAKSQSRRIVKSGLAHVISSDGHNTSTRLPLMSVCMDFLSKNCSADYIRDLTWNNACRIIGDELF